MGIRNCRDLGENLQKIVQRLMENRNLIKLLYYTDKDPLVHDFSELIKSEENPDGKYSSYDEFCAKEIFEKLIKIVPRVGPKETSASIIALQVVNGRQNSENNEFKNVKIIAETFVPLTQWIIKSDNLRPFQIMGEIQESLVGKTINGLGKMAGGDFEINFLTEEISCYEQTFSLISYE